MLKALLASSTAPAVKISLELAMLIRPSARPSKKRPSRLTTNLLTCKSLLGLKFFLVPRKKNMMFFYLYSDLDVCSFIIKIGDRDCWLHQRLLRRGSSSEVFQAHWRIGLIERPITWRNIGFSVISLEIRIGALLVGVHPHREPGYYEADANQAADDCEDDVCARSHCSIVGVLLGGSRVGLGGK